jgi:hypothetical protein
MITHPAVLKFPTARNVAAAMLITSPKNVRTFGLIFDSANARTISRMIRFALTPIARVKVISVA